MGQQLSGVFTFSQTTTSKGIKVARIGFTDVKVFLGDPGTDAADPADGGTGLVIERGTGALLLMPGGIAGSFSAPTSR